MELNNKHCRVCGAVLVALAIVTTKETLPIICHECHSHQADIAEQNFSGFPMYSQTMTVSGGTASTFGTNGATGPTGPIDLI